MEHYEIFTSYLEGTLPVDEEQKLFSAMNFDDGLRSQFRRFVAIDRTFKSTAGIYVPPNDVTNKLYAGLGFTIPEIIHEPVPVPKNNFIQSPLFKYLMVGLGSSVATLLLVLWLFNPKSDVLNNSKQQQITELKTVPQIQSNEIQNKAAVEKPKNIIRYIYVENKNENDNEVENKEDTPIVFPDKLSLSSINNYRTNNEKLNLYVEKPAFDVNWNKKENSITEYINSDTKLSRFSVQLSGSQSESYPAPTIMPSKLPLFNNCGIAFAYDLSDILTIGAEYRKENYFLRYHFYDNNGYGFTLEIQPNFDTWSGFIKANLLRTGNLQTFLQLTAGFNQAGFVDRAMLGAEWNAYPNLSFMFGLEHSNMIFKKSGTNSV